MNATSKQAAQNRAVARCRTDWWIAGVIFLTLIVTMDCRIWENNAAAAEPDPSKLIGRWLRPDGGYLLELSDVNYEGSTYLLAYDPKTDRLAGIYFQAILKQQFEVVFQRTKHK
jgi:hypothetical protein